MRLLLAALLMSATILLGSVASASADRFAGWYRNCPTTFVSTNGRMQVAVCGQRQPSWVVRCGDRSWVSASPQVFTGAGSRSFAWCDRHVHAL